jgi:hypothetical protein
MDTDMCRAIIGIRCGHCFGIINEGLEDERGVCEDERGLCEEQCKAELHGDGTWNLKNGNCMHGRHARSRAVIAAQGDSKTIAQDNT